MAPQLEIDGLRISNGDLVTITISTPQTGAPTTTTGRVGDINHFDHTFEITTADDTIERHTFGKADGTTISRVSGPMWNVRQGTMTNWDPDQRRFVITNNIGVTEHFELGPPFATPPSWSLVPGPWMLGGSRVGAVDPGLDGHPPPSINPSHLEAA